jgi:hypothetical protein
MEETKSSYESSEAERWSDRLAHSPLYETFMGSDGVPHPRYSIHDLGQKRGRKLGFLIWDHSRFDKVNHPLLKTRRAAEWYLIEMKPNQEDFAAPGSVGGILKESPSNAEPHDQFPVVKGMPA